MDNIIRIQFALEHIMDNSVMIVPREDWHNLVLSDGEPTELIEVPQPLKGLMSMAARVITAGSGIVNPSPGIDVVRYDPRDAPYIYNIYHYIVIENFPLHPQYHEALTTAGVKESEELRSALLNNAFVVGPYEIDGQHWSKEIPEGIKNARQK